MKPWSIRNASPHPSSVGCALLTGQCTLGTHEPKTLSSFDIEIAHGGDAQQALRTAKHLVGNHIHYYQEKIAELKRQPEQLVLL